MAAPPPISLFGQLPNISSIELSPDGTRWAAVMGNDRQAQIQVRSLADNKLLSLTQADKSKVRDVMWGGNDHVIATISTTTAVPGLEGNKREWFLLLDLDLTKGKDWRPLLTGLEDTMNVAAGTPRVVMRESQPVLVVPGIHFESSLGVISLIEVRLGKSGGRVVNKGLPDTTDYIIGLDGKAIAREDYVSRTGEWRLMQRTGDSFRKIYSEMAPIDRPSISSFGRDEQTLVLTSHKGGYWQDYEVKLADGSVGEPTDDYAGSVVTDRRTRLVIGTMETKLDKVEYSFFNPKEQALWRGLAKAFPGEQIRLESWSDDRQTILIEVQGEKNGVALFRVDRAKGQVEFLADRYAGLGPEQLSPVTTLTYKAADGLDIPAYLTLPRDKPAKGLPLIVLAHGGPEARDYPGFDWWAQALASRGYAVLQPQFRGSIGFGAGHRQAGYGQWGRKMQTDLSDGVRDLVAKGMVDKGRVCIVGASYGGYAAMAGPTLDPGVYRCASAVAGVSDLRRMLNWEANETGGTRNSVVRYWQRYMGAKSNNDPAVDAWSPARLAAKVTVPMQLIHGKDDTVVPIEQSRIMRDAMKDEGKTVEWLELPGEDHWLSRPATRIAMLEAQVAFLERHNPPN